MLDKDALKVCVVLAIERTKAIVRLRAYPKTPAALQVIQAQAKWRKAL